jgi:hypothetical protein
MTDRTQFEAMLEALINEDQEQAKEIFHNIVVAKSREIYEELLSEDFDAKDDEDEKHDGVDEAFGEEDSEDDSEEPADDMEGDDAEDDAEDDDMGDDDVGGDATDDLIGDVSDEEGSMSDEEQSDRILDLEDALEELKAEFEQLMADEGDEGSEEMPMDGMDAGADMMGGDEPMMGADAGEQDELAKFMEYVDKVALPKHGDNGANTKSIVAGKNNMGGTTANIAKSFSTEKGGTQGGLLNPSTKEENFGNVNVPGGNAGKTAFKKKEPGHGAEKKGAGENADNKSSLIGSRK